MCARTLSRPAALLGTLVALLAIPPSVRGVRAAEVPKLLFTSVREGKPNLFLINADGSDERQLTREGGSLAAWSPDGKRIAFTSERDGNADLYVMDADGTNVRRLTSSNPDRENQVAWSPDGKRLLFHRHTDNPLSDEVLVMDADGTHEVNLSNNPAFDGDAAWSPDGKQILFVSDRNQDGFRLFLMAPDGINVRPLPVAGTGWVFPTWSPDGKQIAYTNQEGNGLELFLAGADGTNARKLTASAGSNTFAAWSPDGKEIAFEHYQDETMPGELWITSTDGTSQRRLAMTGPPLSGRPAWKPQ